MLLVSREPDLADWYDREGEFHAGAGGFGVPFLKQGDNAIELAVFVESGMFLVPQPRPLLRLSNCSGGKLADLILVDGTLR